MPGVDGMGDFRADRGEGRGRGNHRGDARDVDVTQSEPRQVRISQPAQNKADGAGTATQKPMAEAVPTARRMGMSQAVIIGTEKVAPPIPMITEKSQPSSP